MKWLQILMYCYCVVIGFGCASDSDIILVPDINGPSPSDWLVPRDQVFDVGIGKDGIPSIDDPKFDDPIFTNPAFDDEIVIGIEVDGVLKAYPVPILDWHEVVNDKINDSHYALTYCPLTATAVAWNRRFANEITTFGVSGLLYNTNLMPYDRRTNSTWSQHRLECVHGTLIEQRPETITLIETKFSTWKKAFPESRIMTANTGFDRRYSVYPYGDYKSNHDRFLFPVDRLDERLPAKERVLGVLIDGRAKAYSFNEIENGVDIIHDQFQGQELVIARSARDNYNTAFLNTEGKAFTSIQEQLPSIMMDEVGNEYNLLGVVIKGPNIGERLERPHNFIGMWFSWGAFYPDLEIYGQ